MSEQGMTDWGTFWVALEAVGTIAAVFAVVCLAWWERSKDRRSAERKRAAIRTLLRLEIERNVEYLHWHVIQNPSDFGEFNYSAFLDLDAETYSHTKDRLEEQLDLYTSALDAHEILRVTDFYKKLSQLVDARQKLISCKWEPGLYLHAISVGALAGLVSRTEFAALEEHHVEDVIFYAMKRLYTTGQEIARSLEIAMH